MKRMMTWMLAAALVLALAGCGQAASSSSAVPKDYLTILQDARTQEENDAFQVVYHREATGMTGLSEEEAANMAPMMLDTMGLDEALCESYAMSLSLMNVHAYGIGVFKPVEGKADAVKAAAESYVAAQVRAQENYLPDQYEIAKSAIVEQVPSGEIILVMCDNAQTVAESLRTALKA